MGYDILSIIPVNHPKAVTYIRIADLKWLIRLPTLNIFTLQYLGTTKKYEKNLQILVYEFNISKPKNTSVIYCRLPALRCGGCNSFLF